MTEAEKTQYEAMVQTKSELENTEFIRRIIQQGV